MTTFRTGPQTDRLRHRAFTPDDAESVYAFNSIPEVMRYTGEPLWPDVEETRRRINAYPDFDRYGYGRWGIIHKADQRIIGFSGFKWIEEFQAPDLGYRLLPEYWGQGSATESGRACIDFGFEHMDFERIVATVMPGNGASVRGLAKLGFQEIGRGIVDGEEDIIFSLDRP